MVETIYLFSHLQCNRFFGSIDNDFGTVALTRTPVYSCVLRILFTPMFLLCNYQPKGVTGTAPRNDWVYWIIGIVFGLPQDYLTSLEMMWGPKTVTPEEQSTEGKFCGAYLITGIIAAIGFSFVL
ncbi:hypothetical protein QYM36_006298 [Artemia franciscana]|uniref:Uncharacterized protein n=1 Tax=Artemia franciscana TaxID=6661 RepID=A0AA88HUT8_ARTSF|nr:hypothetical protein QYM36_006298 [Artemia franciscana]